MYGATDRSRWSRLSLGLARGRAGAVFPIGAYSAELTNSALDPRFVPVLAQPYLRSLIGVLRI